MGKERTMFVKKFLLLFGVLFGVIVTTIQAQSRLAPCSKQDYELLENSLKEYFDPWASEQYMVMDGNKEKYALYLKKKGILHQPYGTLSVKDAKATYIMRDDSLCYRKLASLLRFSVCASSSFVRDKLGGKTWYLFFDLYDGAQYWGDREHIQEGSLIDILEQACHAVKRNEPRMIRCLFPQIDSLTQHFKTFELEESWDVETSEYYQKDALVTELSTHYHGYSFDFFTTNVSRQALLEQYGALLRKTAKWLFAHSTVLDFNERVYIRIVPDMPAEEDRYSYSYGHYYLTVVESELAEDKLLQLLTKYFADSDD
ncbi:MAG: hypothetical protein K6A82_04490 [Prevotella sp.]|nr:hypothetical protein [Prevotella sp.]